MKASIRAMINGANIHPVANILDSKCPLYSSKVNRITTVRSKDCHNPIFRVDRVRVNRVKYQLYNSISPTLQLYIANSTTLYCQLYNSISPTLQLYITNCTTLYRQLYNSISPTLQLYHQLYNSISPTVQLYIANYITIYHQLYNSISQTVQLYITNCTTLYCQLYNSTTLFL